MHVLRGVRRSSICVAYDTYAYYTMPWYTTYIIIIYIHTVHTWYEYNTADYIYYTHAYGSIINDGGIHNTMQVRGTKRTQLYCGFSPCRHDDEHDNMIIWMNVSECYYNNMLCRWWLYPCLLFVAPITYTYTMYVSYQYINKTSKKKNSASLRSRRLSPHIVIIVRCCHLFFMYMSWLLRYEDPPAGLQSAGEPPRPQPFKPLWFLPFIY